MTSADVWSVRFLSGLKNTMKSEGNYDGPVFLVEV